MGFPEIQKQKTEGSAPLFQNAQNGKLSTCSRKIQYLNSHTECLPKWKIRSLNFTTLSGFCEQDCLSVAFRHSAASVCRRPSSSATRKRSGLTKRESASCTKSSHRAYNLFNPDQCHYIYVQQLPGVHCSWRKILALMRLQ